MVQELSPLHQQVRYTGALDVLTPVDLGADLPGRGEFGAEDGNSGGLEAVGVGGGEEPLDRSHGGAPAGAVDVVACSVVGSVPEEDNILSYHHIIYKKVNSTTTRL